MAKKFDELVRSFLTGFDFDRHPQCDLQWSLLSLLLNLSNETNKSELKGLKVSTGDDSLNSNLANKNGDCEEIDWREYLKEGERDFYKDYQSSGESVRQNCLFFRIYWTYIPNQKFYSIRI